MKIKDRPEFKTKSAPLTFGPSEKVSVAVAAMTEKNYGSVVVVDRDDRPIGMVTERDILTRLVHKNLDPDVTDLETIMTRDLKLARADDAILDWVRIMSNERFRRLPVIDDDGHIVAIMTQGDFVAYTWPDLIYHAAQMSKATMYRYYQIALIAGGIILYIILIAMILNLRNGT